MKKIIMNLGILVIGIITMESFTLSIYANEVDTLGLFNHNYEFTSGSDYRQHLGNPTTYNGSVDINVYNANIRRDKNVALFPPQYGIFSGEFATPPTNPYFTHPNNVNFLHTTVTQDPNRLPVFDTLQQGVNYQHNTQMQYQVGDGFLPSTSIR